MDNPSNVDHEADGRLALEAEATAAGIGPGGLALLGCRVAGTVPA